MEIRKHLPHRSGEQTGIIDWPPRAVERVREVRARLRSTDGELVPSLDEDALESSLANRYGLGEALLADRPDLITGLAMRAMHDIIKPSKEPR